MHLLTGPAGSGKTAWVLDRIREALRKGDSGVRLLVPTATMAQHLQNRLAREGFVFPGSLIQTLSRFLDDWAGRLRQVPDAVLYLIVEDAVRRVDRLEFAQVEGLHGFSASLARTIEEFASAGCDSERLRRNLPATPLGEAFAAVYREVEKELARRGLAMRAALLQEAARRIETEGMGPIRAMYFDGFHALPDPELAMIRAMAGRTDLTLTLAANRATAATRERLLAMNCTETRLPPRRSSPALVLVKAPSIEREADEIARRILEQSRAGRPFREMGIIVRPAEMYVPVLRATLDRFGIPAHFYFDSRVEQHPATRFLVGVIDALTGGWEHAATLAVLRLWPRGVTSIVMDRLEYQVRRQMPNRGLGPLKGMLLPDPEGPPPPPGSERILRFLDQLGELEEWESFILDPKDWAARFRTLRNLFRPARPSAANHELALAWRSQAAVLDLFDEALAEAATALDGQRPVPLDLFWRAVKSVLRLKPLRLDDRRRNAVHVLSAPEARQWELPVVFVCGMVERQFPQFQRQDPFFPDAARVRLNAAGIRVRTAAEFEIEERALFDSALSSATMLVTLTHPEFDARGDRALPSIYLEDLLAPRDDSREVRPAPRVQPAPRPPVAIADARLLERLRTATAALGPTSLEQYLQCPFQFFGGRTLRLEPAPDRPEQRLNFMLQGSIVHRVLHEWGSHPQQPIQPVFDRVFAEMCEEEGVPAGYRTECIRASMLDDLRAYTLDSRWPREGFRSRTEVKFAFPLDGALEIRGRIDRLDVDAAGRAYVIDYKYSGKQGTKDKLSNENLLQAPLYCLAVKHCFGVEPAGMFYIGLRGGVQYAGWAGEDSPVRADPMPNGWTERAAQRSLQAAAQIREGRIAPGPSDADHCRFCDFADVCRLECAAPQAVSEGA